MEEVAGFELLKTLHNDVVNVYGTVICFSMLRAFVEAFLPIS